MKKGAVGGVLGSGRDWGVGRVCGVGRGSRNPGCSNKDVLVALDLLDLIAADEDLQLAGSSFDRVEVQLNLNGVSSHQSPNAESQKEPVTALCNCWDG